MSKPHSMFPAVRLRRNRKSPWVRNLVREHTLTASDLIWPMFVIDGKDKTEAVSSMPGVTRYSIDNAVKQAREAQKLGIPLLALFPNTDPKLRDEGGTRSLQL